MPEKSVACGNDGRICFCQFSLGSRQAGFYPSETLTPVCVATEAGRKRLVRFRSKIGGKRPFARHSLNGRKRPLSEA